MRTVWCHTAITDEFNSIFHYRELHALQNATESHSAKHATHTGWHKRTGTFEMRSSSERMHTWRRTPSTGRNFQTLLIWITVS